MIKDVEIEKGEKPEEEFDDSPVYFDPLADLSDDEKDQLTTSIKKEFEAIEAERDAEELEQKWESLDRQYGEGPEENQDTMFNIHSPVTKVKCQSVAGDMHQAYVNVDPKFSITPRPEYAREGGQEVCDAQQDFLDYEMDKSNHDLDRVNRLIEMSAVVKGTGIKKKFHKVQTARRVRKERYKGTPEVVGVDQQGQPIVENKGLEEFISKYPTAIEDYPRYVKALGQGKEIWIDVKYTETIKDKPVDSFVKLKNFYVRVNTQGYEGLCTTRLIAEDIPYYWWELKAEEKKGFFFDIDKLKDDYDEKTETMNERDGYHEEEYRLLMCTFWWDREGEDEPTKVIAWIERERWQLLGVILYPYDGVDSFYIPYHCKIEKDGFYQPGMAEELTDLNVAENALWNFGLEGMVLSNTLTPIIKEGDGLEEQFLNNEFTHGVPLVTSKGVDQISTLQSLMKPMNLNDVIASLHLIGRMEDDVSRVSSLKTGGENPVDPQAPATKTLALMRQTDKNIRDYIECMVPSYNLDAFITLQMYAQIDREGGFHYKLRADKVTGDNPFATITRNEMVARTNIQSRAMAFDFDKLAEKSQDLALLQVLLQEYMIAKRPESRHLLYKTIIKGWSPKWRNIVDAVLPSLQELQAEQAALAAQGTAIYLQKQVEESQITGEPMQINPVELAQVVEQFAQQAVIPAEEEKGNK